MRATWVSILTWFTCYLFIAPLPTVAALPKFHFATVGFRRNKKIQLNFDEQLQFLYCIKTQLLSGATQIMALQFALSRIDKVLLPETRLSISLRSDIYSAMNRDAVEFKFRALEDYGILMQASAISGASISQPLSNLASAMIRDRAQEQLLASELASTKATVLVLAGLPIIGFVLAMMLGSQSITWLFVTSGGRTCLMTGLALELCGLLWIRRLLRKAVSDQT